MRARVAADLVAVLVGGERVDPAAALEELLVDVRSVRGDEQLPFALRAAERLRHLHVAVGERALGPQAVLDLLGERDLDRVVLDRRPVGAGRRLDRGKSAAVVARRGLRERDRPPGRLARDLLREPPVAGEPPGASDEDAHAEPLRLEVADRLDAAVLRRHRLRPPADDPRVRIGGADRERGVHGRGAEVAHPAYLIGVPEERAPRLGALEGALERT